MSTVGITGKEPDPRQVYADIIDLPHHQSTKHPHMSLYDRAAQFAPFAALVGYEDMVAEEARVTDQAAVLDEEALKKLDRKLNVIARAIAEGNTPEVTITCFVPDEHKAGGSCRTAVEEIRRIDLQKRQLVLTRTEGRTGTWAVIPLDRITELSGELVDYLDDWAL